MSDKLAMQSLCCKPRYLLAIIRIVAFPIMSKIKWMRCQYICRRVLIGCISVQRHIQYRVSRGESTGKLGGTRAKINRHFVLAKILGSWYLPCLSYRNFRKRGPVNRESAIRSKRTYIKKETRLLAW